MCQSEGEVKGSGAEGMFVLYFTMLCVAVPNNDKTMMEMIDITTIKLLHVSLFSTWRA